MKKFKNFIYVFWTIGFVAILIIADKLQIFLSNKRAQTYEIQPYVSMELLICFIIGIYISLLFIRHWKLNINVYFLLFVFLPSILFIIMSNFIYILNINVNIVAIVSGLTLFPGIFGNSNIVSTQNDSN
jgi:hypothetical protein